jgi:3-oxoacyl-[acyl-carrier protein] reductase
MTKTAIVTGSSRGIGREVALRLARDGFAVTVNYASGEVEAKAVQAEISAAGGKAIVVKANVADPKDCETLFAETEKAFGGVDVLVNNAGVMKLAPIAETDDALFTRMFDINVRGSFNLMRLAATRLRSGGRVINFSSSALGLNYPGYATYCATKAAIESYTAIFARELRGREITVNAVAPGPTATELFFDGKDEAFVERLTKLSPLERLGQPADIARAVSFLAGPEGGWINGQVLRANGGTV